MAAPAVGPNCSSTRACAKSSTLTSAGNARSSGSNQVRRQRSTRYKHAFRGLCRQVHNIKKPAMAGPVGGVEVSPCRRCAFRDLPFASFLIHAGRLRGASRPHPHADDTRHSDKPTLRSRRAAGCGRCRDGCRRASSLRRRRFRRCRSRCDAFGLDPIEDREAQAPTRRSIASLLAK